MSNNGITEMVRRVIEDTIAPALASHGGSVEMLSCDEESGVVRVALTGACGTCPFAQETLRIQVEGVIKKEVPGITKVERL